MARKSGFIAGFSPEDAYILKPDLTKGVPGILGGRSPEGSDVLIKLWPRRKGADDSELEDLWKSELRQLQRLAATPSADDLFVPVLANGKDSDGFYLVMDPGQGSLLQRHLDPAKRSSPLAHYRTPRGRRLLWQNIRRIVSALEILHSQGTIHRNIGPWAVVTALSTTPDFRLTGFEWSIRVMAIERDNKSARSSSDSSYSFARDWRDLGLLASLLLDVPSARIADMRIIPSRVAEHLTTEEVRLLRILMGAETVDRLDGELLSARVDSILQSVAAEVAGKEPEMCLAVRLGPNSRVTSAVRKAANNEIEVSDQEGQIEFILNDLSGDTRLVALKDQPDAELRYVLLGSQLVYRIGPFRRSGPADLPTWEFAYCDRADEQDPHRIQILGELKVDPSWIEVYPSGEANQIFPRKRGKVRSWDKIIDELTAADTPISEMTLMHRAFALLLMLEMGRASAEMYPVNVISAEPGEEPDQIILKATARADKDREELAELLGLQAPAMRMDLALEGSVNWTLSESQLFGDKAQNTTTWQYIGAESTEDGGDVYAFRGTKVPAHRSFAYLFADGASGTIAQFRRRLKALSALSGHAELLRMFIDPRGHLQASADVVKEQSPEFLALDQSKRAALREILSVIPIFLLQGPPGVGKTFLVADIVKRQLSEEPTGRLLLSAQSNSAVDHLMREIKDVLADDLAKGGSLMVRARPMDDDETEGEFEIDFQARRLLQDLAASELVASTTPRLRDRTVALANSANGQTHPESTRRRGSHSDLRAFEGMILRSANLVFATTNSRAVEQLIDEQSYFDWSVVEEAGKATGGELLSPLLLSHRRLMIGDHKQLAPFDATRVLKILESTDVVRKLIELVDHTVSRSLKDSGFDEVLQELSNPDVDIGRSCADALRQLLLFESMVEAEFKRQNRRPRSPNIARRLNEQYRMHPAIAKIVSDSFYQGELTTNAQRAKYFNTTKPPVKSIDPLRLPEKPIVFIDIPYSRSAPPGVLTQEELPAYTNPAEIAAIRRTIEVLRPSQESGSASLAVLSPYSRQVTALSSVIDDQRSGTLAHLKDFQPAVNSEKFCGTVDSFQGGEADVVLVSLVRNNHHLNSRRALGFLTEAPRMNVLLSRAKWRLILVGSLEFFRKVNGLGRADRPANFFDIFLESLDRAKAAGEAAIVPISSLMQTPK